jgi:hypothetical protein
LFSLVLVFTTNSYTCLLYLESIKRDASDGTMHPSSRRIVGEPEPAPEPHSRFQGPAAVERQAIANPHFSRSSGH